MTSIRALANVNRKSQCVIVGKQPSLFPTTLDVEGREVFTKHRMSFLQHVEDIR